MTGLFERAVAVVRDLLLIIVLIAVIVVGYYTFVAASKLQEPTFSPQLEPTPTHFKTKGSK
jgi:hypothetical protein